MGIFKKRKYVRKVGAVAWPSLDQPAFALIMGEELREDSNDPKACWMIAEQEDQNLVRLLKWCAKQGKKHGVDYFHGNTASEPMMNFLHSLKMEFYINKAPFCDSPEALQYYINLIKTSTQPEQKMLHFGSSVIPNKLVGMGDKVGVSAQDFPALAACGYALSVLTEEYIANPQIDVAHSVCGAEYGGNLNSSAGHYSMSDTPTAQRWKNEPGGDW
jgi:hypothetical protein